MKLTFLSKKIQIKYFLLPKELRVLFESLIFALCITFVPNILRTFSTFIIAEGFLIHLDYDKWETFQMARMMGKEYPPLDPEFTITFWLLLFLIFRVTYYFLNKRLLKQPTPPSQKNKCIVGCVTIVVTLILFWILSGIVFTILFK